MQTVKNWYKRTGSNTNKIEKKIFGRLLWFYGGVNIYSHQGMSTSV